MKPIRRNSIPHDSRSRDAALRRLRRANRWLIAGSAVLTGLFADLAASAFAGHAKAATRSGSKEGSKTHHGSTKPLKPPAQAPQAAETQTAPQTSEAPAPSEEAAAEEAAPEASAPTREAAPEPAPEQSEPEAQESAPPAPEEEPVVSGGS